MAEYNLLQKKILTDGVIKPGNVLKVDSFLNHQIDVPFVSVLGKEFYDLFKDRPIDKILTIEASGIGIASLTAVYFQVPVLFAKKSAGSNMDKERFYKKGHRVISVCFPVFKHREIHYPTKFADFSPERETFRKLSFCGLQDVYLFIKDYSISPCNPHRIA